MLLGASLVSKPLPLRWCTIDPGDRHVGFCTWSVGQCVEAVELTPEQCVQTLELLLSRRALDCIVYEKFALYAWNEKSMAGNEFETSQLIGVIKYLAGRAGIKAHGQLASEHKRIYRMGWFLELDGRAKRAMPWWGKGPHVKDAWVIGQWFIRQCERA